MSPELALRNAVTALLLASPEVGAIVRDKIRDDVPGDDEADLLPWICFGPINTLRVETGGVPAWSIKLRVFAESAGFDRDEAWTIARAAIRAVDRQEPPAEGGFCDRLSVSQAGDVLDPGKIKTVFFDVTCLQVDAG